MTVEERANKLFFSIDSMLDVTHRKAITEAVIQALRDQIEECVNIVAGEAMLCSKGDETGHIKPGYIGLHDAWLRIRALAASGENKQEKGD